MQDVHLDINPNQVIPPLPNTMKRLLTAHTFQVCSLLEGTSSQAKTKTKQKTTCFPVTNQQCDNLTALNTVQTHLQAAITQTPNLWFSALSAQCGHQPIYS